MPEHLRGAVWKQLLDVDILRLTANFNYKVCTIRFQTFDCSCMSTIEVGIMYDQTVKGTVIKIKSRQGCISFKHKDVYKCAYLIYIVRTSIDLIIRVDMCIY